MTDPQAAAFMDAALVAAQTPTFVHRFQMFGHGTDRAIVVMGGSAEHEGKISVGCATPLLMERDTMQALVDRIATTFGIRAAS